MAKNLNFIVNSERNAGQNFSRNTGAVGAVSLCVHCRFSPERHDYSSYVVDNIYNNVTVLNCNSNSLLLSKPCK